MAVGGDRRESHQTGKRHAPLGRRCRANDRVLDSSRGSANKGFESWADMARWQDGLDRGRRTASPEIKQKVADLTKADATPLGKMRSLAQSVQKDVRYVAIQLGIGGWHPHPAP